MARHNYVFLYGRVSKPPKILMDDSGGLIRGQCMITTIRSERSSEDEFYSFRYDCPIIMTKNPDILKEMTRWKENDMVEVKGMVSTRKISRSTICPYCKTRNLKAGALLYITPTYCAAIETGISKETCYELLRKKCEISNQCIVVGNLCSNPKVHQVENGSCQTCYQIALKRKLHVREDPPELKADFPWVKSIGANAAKDAKCLMKGSSVLVDGKIRTSEIVRKNICGQCGREYGCKDQAMEIIPYCTEYLLNCRSLEEGNEQDESVG